MHYATGPTVVLGQWHSPYVSEHSCIYNGDGPTITNIYFRMSKSQQYQIVTDIGFSMDRDEAVRILIFKSSTSNGKAVVCLGCMSFANMSITAYRLEVFGVL